jgi:hypothetical protein
MQYEYVMPWQHVSPICSSPKEKKLLPNIDGVRIVSGKVTFIPVVSSSGMAYAIVVSVHIEKT